MKIFGEKNRRLVVVILAIISIFTWEYNNYSFFVLLAIAIGYSIYAISTNEEFSKKKKVINSIIVFMSSIILFAFSVAIGDRLLGFDNKPPSCNSIETKQTLNEMLKEGIPSFEKSNKYIVESAIINKFSEEENTYYCTATLAFDIKNNEQLKKEPKVIQDAMKGILEMAKRTLEFKVSSDEKGYYNVEIL